MSAIMSDEATAAGIAEAVRSRSITAVEVAEAALARIARSHEAMKAFTTVTAQRALTEAAGVDAAVNAGRDPGPLAGVPFAAKNLFDLAGVVTLAGSKVLA